MKIIKWIDPHVHLRWLEQPTNWAQIGIQQAEALGCCCLMEMPNTNPPMISSGVLFERRAMLNTHIIIGQHVGLTNDSQQVAKMLSHCSSDKIFYCHSTGDMGILDPDYQRWIWNYKGMIGYRGVSMGHFEEESLFDGEFDVLKPLSHGRRQCPTAETVSVDRQLRNAVDARFQGTFYICHVSNPATVELVKDFRKRCKFDIILEATWHHLFLNEDHWLDNRWKCNPPLRSRQMQERLLSHLLAGNIDLIGSDHAPHSLESKSSENPPSGIPSIPFWPMGIAMLKRGGLPDSWIERLIFRRANQVFGLRLNEEWMDVGYDGSMWDAYGWNPFARVQ